MLKKTLVTFVSACTALSSFAQDSATSSPLNISGYVDLYYKYDFAKTPANNRTSFTSAYNSFALGMASVKFDKSWDKVGFVADLGFGPRAKDFSYNDNGITAAIKQLYVTYSPSEKVKFTAGSWATHIGYEVVDAPANRNYSMSYMFSYGPFFNTGLKAEYFFGKSTLMLGIANPTDYKVSTEAPRKVLAQFATATKNDKVKIYLNYVGGKSNDSTKANQLDLVATAALTDKFSIGYNGTVATHDSKVNGKFDNAQTWWGSALYLNFDPCSKFGLTLREEYFSDKDQALMPLSGLLGGNVFATTLSGNIRLSSALTVIPELRLEQASKEAFFKENGQSTKSSASALVAAVYKF